MNRDLPLPARRLEGAVSLVQAQPWNTSPVTPDSPAVEVMTDLTEVKAATVSPAATLQQAEQAMIWKGVRMLFVVTEMPSVQGLITSTDLRGPRPLRLVQQRGLRFDEITVADVMTPLAALEAVDYDDLRHAYVGNVVATLKKHGRNHLLVAQQAAPGLPALVRGVFSRSQVERQLGRALEVVEVANSFADLGVMLT